MDRPLLDLSYLERLYKGDRSRMEQWMRMYLEVAPTYFAKLSDGLKSEDPKDLAFAAHELRPQAHYLGAPRLLELLLALEQCARTEGVPSCRPLVDELLALGRAVDTELRAWLTVG
ncbi:MAG: Hpt domain-containing protein [Flavobacteriales bacterium]|nr:Hpt domain-containing protein [Flavobacteriales bacterium]